MKIAIVGWGVEGQSAYRYFGLDNDYLIVNEEPRADFPQESARVKVQFINSPRTPGLTGNVKDTSYLDSIENYDKIVLTPTARKVLEDIFPDDNPIWKKVTTDRHIFFETVKTKNIIGVTGSKGKGTTSTLTTKLLEAQGKKVFLGGNIGKSVLDFVNDVQPNDWVVLELANFQLYKFPYSPHIGVCLMITEEHLDWHPDMEDYIQAKVNLFRHQTADDIAIYFAKNDYSKRIAGYSPGEKIPYYEAPGAFVRDDGMIVIGGAEVVNKSEVKLLGEHNLQNVCAALTAVNAALGTVDNAKSVLTSFSGLEHRLELVRELDGVKYYDDSFATTPETVIVALQAMTQPVVLILGGHDKGLDYKGLISEITKNDHVRHVITIGKIGQKLAAMLKEQRYNSVTEGLEKMPEMVAEAQKQARPGDVVLLSSGSSSFGLFKDYKDRGDQFKQAVQELA